SYVTTAARALYSLSLHDALPIYDAIERSAGRELRERAEPSCHADVAGREDVETSQAAEEDQRRAPGTDAPKLREEADRVGTLHRSEEHTSELQSRENLVCRLLLE